MSSELIVRRDGSFIVRIWWEHGDGEGETGAHWRGWIQHVRNGKTVYFADIRDLTDFIEREIGVRSPTEETPQGLV